MARNVVVTGGGTGIGRAVAAAFAADGDIVVITGRRPEPLRATATEASAPPASLMRPDQRSVIGAPEPM